MARLAIGGGIDVIYGLATRRHPVVAGLTAPGNMIVVNHNRRPYQSGMTGVAGIAAADMVGNLPGRGGAVVATDARAQHNAVIDPVGRPQLGVMAGFALE